MTKKNLLSLTDFMSSDNRLVAGMNFFNSSKWYEAHDVFEEVWHETDGNERILIQALLQLSVANVHLQKSNYNGATILLGEALGRLRSEYVSSLNYDITEICLSADKLLSQLHSNIDKERCKEIKILIK